MRNIDYTAPPTVARFMKSESFGRLIAGPVGSGKTMGCIFELVRRACAQDPGADGLRHTRFAIVRQTLQQLKTTILKDITQYLGDTVDYKVSESTVYFRVGDVRSEWMLLPLETPEDQQRLLSSQLTGAWMSECIEMNVDLIAPLAGRCGRYPSNEMGVPSWRGIVADTNLPAEGSRWWEFMTAPPIDWQIFRQPGGLSTEAENLNWLNQDKITIALPLDSPDRIARGRAFYERNARNNNPDWVRRYVHAEFGNDPSGSAVFRTTFKRSFHVVDSLEPTPSRLIIVGQDFGRDPFSVITQLDHRGRLLILEEVLADDVGLDAHIRHGLRPAIFHERYLGRPVAVCGDPAGRNRSSLYEENEFDLLQREGFRAFPAPTNDPDRRIIAVEKFLMGQIDGGPMLVIDGSRCPTLIRAMDGGYRFGKSRNGQRKPKPDKNEYSHVADALQYAALASLGDMHGMISGHLMRSSRLRRSGRARFDSRAWT